MMEKFEVELLDPLFYNSSLDSGAAGSTITFPWLGDLALDYAINFSLNLNNSTFKYNSHKPDYSEIKNFGFVASVGYSVSNVNKTRVYDFATSFISDGYIDSKTMEKVKRAPFRNWIKRQGISPGTKFYFYILKNRNINFPSKFSIRLGNMKSCIASVKKIETEANDKLWINLYTLNLIREVDTNNIHSSNIEYYSERYIILKNILQKDFTNLFGGYT